MKTFSLKSLITYSIMSCCCTPANTQSKWQATVIKMDKRFDAVTEISSIVYWQDTVYLASPKCDIIYIGKINEKDSLEIIATKALGECDFEGASYYQDHFYFSDDQQNSIARYSRGFGSQPVRFPIQLHGNEGAGNNYGFEGIAAINDTTFYILLEKGSAGVSVLYKGLLRNGKIYIDAKKRMMNRMRYCDLFYDHSFHTLYLLKTTRGNYTIDSLVLDTHHNIVNPGDSPGTLSTTLMCDFSDQVQRYDTTHGTNVEGMAMADKDTCYVVSDNCNSVMCACGKTGEGRKTLLLRLRRSK